MTARLEIDFRTEEMAELATTVGERSLRTGPRTTTITDDDPLPLYRTFGT